MKSASPCDFPRMVSRGYDGSEKIGDYEEKGGGSLQRR